MFRNSPVTAWRNSEQRYELTGSQCVLCKASFYTKPYYCSCGSSSFQSITFSGRGTLVSFTQITIPPVEFTHVVPYIIGLVQLEEGPRLITQIADAELAELAIDMPVKSIFRRYFADGDRGLIHYGLKFTPENLG